MTTLSPETEVRARAHQLLSPVTAAGNYAAAMATALKAGTLTPETTAAGLTVVTPLTPITVPGENDHTHDLHPEDF